MRFRRAGNVGALLLAVGVLCSTGQVYAQEEVPGEQIDWALIDQGYIESMDEVIERDRLIRPEESRKERRGQPGIWVVPSRRATTSPNSGEHNVVNKWGDPRMGIGFPGLVDVDGAYFAGQSGEGVWTTGVRVLGYRDGVIVQETDWFTEIGAKPAWFEMALRGVDRIEIEAMPVQNGAGWYGMDDLTYSFAGNPGAAVVVDFEDLDYRTTLTGSGYAGLTWETGSGEFAGGLGVPAPQVPPDYRPVELPPGADAYEMPRERAVEPTLVTSFATVKRGDAGSFTFPPDTAGAVGPNHFVVAVNESFAIYNKDTGGQISSVALQSFMPGSSGDPRILFDQYSGRWIVLSTNFSNRIYLAMSMTDDPTGSWFKPNFVASQGADAGCDPDYPTLGVDQFGIYTAAYMVGCGMTIFAIDKEPLLDATPSMGTVTAWRGYSWQGAIQPAHTYGSAPGEYFISVKDSNELRVRRVTGPLTSPSITLVGDVNVSNFGSPPLAPALGSSTDLDTVGDRLMMAVYRDGSLWTCHTVSANGRAACRWYEINATSTSLIQSGTVADSSLSFFFPSIMVNQNGNAVMGFTGSSGSQYAGCYFAGRLAGDAAGTMSTPVQYKAGTGAYNAVDGFGRNRWGDYSHTTLDPIDGTTFWTIQEYGRTTSGSLWGTYVAALSLGDADCNANDIPDLCDIDCGLPGCDEYPDCGQAVDCNGNQTPDECELDAFDCNGNLIPDDCDIASGFSDDCNENGIPDDCDVSSGTSQDCQPNGIPDECDLAPPTTIVAADDCADAELACTGITYTGTTVGATPDGSASCGSASSPDVWFHYRPIGNGFLTISLCGSSFDTVVSFHDGCPGTLANEVGCNDNLCGEQSQLGNILVLNGTDYWVRVSGAGAADTGSFQLVLTGPECEYTAGDCDGNDIPDECDIADCPPDTPGCADCNENGLPDSCDIASGTSLDENGDGVPDECATNCLAKADSNCDGSVNSFDIDAFVLALSDQSAWEAGFTCDFVCANDCNDDSLVNAFDIDAFVAILAGPG